MNVQRAYPSDYRVNAYSLANRPRPVARSTAERGLNRVLVWIPVSHASAQELPPDTTALAKQTQNPVGDLVSLPFQFNFYSGGDLEDQTSFNLNFQPVMPFKLNPRWSLIARTIVPINSVPVGVGARSSGVGDVQEQLFVTPSAPGKIIWGAGPMFSLPIATADASRTGSWALGPGGVALMIHGKWVYGALIQQFRTMADTGGDPAAVDGAVWSRHHTHDSIQRTANPVGIQYYHNVSRPDGSPATQLRMIVSLLYPTKK
jgi:hypothetical protein